jgi:apolipoprotein D and lipocalin family protein
MHNYFKILILFTFSLMISNTVKSGPLEAVAKVDLQRYMGKWYEIASFPQRFQKGCHCTTAEYSISEKGHVVVVNRCNKDSVNGKETSIRGKAFVEEGSNNAKLKVQFFWPFKAKYWIIGLADDYSWAVVSHPNKKYLWILSRSPKMDEAIYNSIISRLREQGLDTGKLVKTVHF